MENNYYVLRTYSHTDTRQLWKVVSSPFENIKDAENWQRYMEVSEKSNKHKFFVVARKKNLQARTTLEKEK